MTNFKKSYLWAGTAIGLCITAIGFADSASAQTNNPAASEKDDAKVVVVIGTRKSLEESVNIKKNSDQFVDAVVAEDIGKLPDTNVAESLSRVSGVQLSQGIGGEGTSITIRGSRDNVTLLNGRQIIDVSGRAGQGLDTLGTSSYGILSIIPSELVSSLTVTKLPGADEIEGALGGTVNIVTRRPLDAGKNIYAGSVEKSFAQAGNVSGYKASVLASFVNKAHNFGFLANVVYANTPIVESNFSSYSGYQSLTSSFNTGNTTGVKADNNGDGVLGSRIADLRYQILDDHRKNIGVNTSMQWRSDNLNIYYDNSYMSIESHRNREWLAVPLSGTGSDWLAVTMSPDDYITGGTETTRLSTNYEYTNLKTDLYSTALGAVWENEHVKISGEADYSLTRGLVEQWAGILTAVNKQTVTFAYQGMGIPSVSVPALDFTNPANFIWTNNQQNRRPTHSTDVALRLDATLKFSSDLWKSLQFGVRTDEVYYATVQSNNSISSTAGSTTLGFNTSATLTPDLVSVFTAGKYFVPGAAVPNVFLTPNENLTIKGCHSFDAYYNATQAATCAPTTVTPLATASVDEKTPAAYIKMNFDKDLGSIGIRGNFGVRYVETKRESTGSTLYNNLGVKSFVPNTYNYDRKDVLPSAVVRVSLPDGFVIRAGAAKAIARPASSLLTSNLTVSQYINSAGEPVFSGSGGAPNLEPYLVNQYDLAGEWYFNKHDLLSLGLFYKDVNTYFVTQTKQEVVPGFNNDQPFNVTRTVNGYGATIKGLEFNYVQSYDFLPAPFNNLGSQVSYSYIQSQTPTIDPTTKVNLPLPGLAKNNLNAIVYYDTKSYGVRIAYNERSPYFDSIGANGAGIFYDKYSNISASAYYNLGDRWKVVLSGSNLGNSRVRIYAGKPEYVKQVSLAEAIYKINLSAKF